MPVAKAATQTASEQARDRLLEAIRVSVELTMETLVAQFPEKLEAERMEQQLEEFRASFTTNIYPGIVEVWPELEPTEAEATVLMAQGPDDSVNRAVVESNMQLIRSVRRPVPPFVYMLYSFMRSNPDFSGWELEALRRMTDGTVRGLREKGELK